MVQGCVMIALYRHFSVSGELLYVGVSMNALVRLSQHKSKPWVLEIASVSIEQFQDRKSAEAAEAVAIRDEAPRYNKANPLARPNKKKPRFTIREPGTKAASVRLSLEHWAKLRALMQTLGRAWLEKAIDREHKKQERQQ